MKFKKGSKSRTTNTSTNENNLTVSQGSNSLMKRTGSANRIINLLRSSGEEIDQLEDTFHGGDTSDEESGNYNNYYNSGDDNSSFDGEEEENNKEESIENEFYSNNDEGNDFTVNHHYNHHHHHSNNTSNYFNDLSSDQNNTNSNVKILPQTLIEVSEPSPTSSKSSNNSNNNSINNLQNNQNNNNFENNKMNNNKIDQKQQQQQSSEMSLQDVRILFTINYSTKPGEKIVMVGDVYELGSWDLEKAANCDWTEGNNWVCEKKISLSDGESFEYKFALVNELTGKPIRWEGGSNHIFHLPPQAERSSLFVSRENWQS